MKLTGTFGSDTLQGTASNDEINGLESNDQLFGGGGSDTLSGGEGNDFIDNSQGNDSFLFGDGGDDQLFGSVLGNDRLDGGTGNDSMEGGGGNDTYIVDSFTDRILERFDKGIDIVKASSSYILPDNVEDLTLTGNADSFGVGNQLKNKIMGNVGDNVLSGGAGSDILNGKDGIDTVVEAGNVNFVLTDSSLNGLGFDRLSSIEQATLSGGNFDSIIDASQFTNGKTSLFGNDGNDTLIGGHGNDQISGDVGDDILTGGAGADRFIYNGNSAFSSANPGSDTITDFTPNKDKIVLDTLPMFALKSNGSGFSVKSEFAVVPSDAKAATSTAIITYSSKTGHLFYNQNGSAAGLGSGGQFAALTGAPTLSAGDFVIQDSGL
jgi:Ca2+-binding RTX toxin-like protein